MTTTKQPLRPPQRQRTARHFRCPLRVAAVALCACGSTVHAFQVSSSSHTSRLHDHALRRLPTLTQLRSTVSEDEATGRQGAAAQTGTASTALMSPSPSKQKNNSVDVDDSSAELPPDFQQDEDIAKLVKASTLVSPQDEYQRGLLTIGFCTLVFASMSPAMHAALVVTTSTPCPVVLLNAAVSVVALGGLVAAGPYLEALIPPPSTLVAQQQQQQEVVSSEEKQAELPTESANPLASLWNSVDVTKKAGLELGLWKFLGTVANLYGLSMTTADHGAFLIQLTTLIVPTVQGMMGVPIPQRIQWAVGLALAGVALFTQDAGSATAAGALSSDTRLLGDALCVVAAGFYATYDLRLFSWGKQVAARELITTKIAVQAMLSFGLLLAVGLPETGAFLQSVSASLSADGTGGLWVLGAIVLWSGVMVNAIVPFLQVGGQQAIGPTRAQTLYASQPLWAAMMSYAFLGETVGLAGLVGGGAFLSALFLAATAEAPDPDCEVKHCEV